MIENFDLQFGMIMAFKLHLSENQVLHVGVFPDKETAEKAGEAAKPVVAQITQMGAKHEVMAGPLTDFMIAGDVTLDQLTGHASWREITLAQIGSAWRVSSNNYQYFSFGKRLRHVHNGPSAAMANLHRPASWGRVTYFPALKGSECDESQLDTAVQRTGR